MVWLDNPDWREMHFILGGLALARIGGEMLFYPGWFSMITWTGGFLPGMVWHYNWTGGKYILPGVAVLNPRVVLLYNITGKNAFVTEWVVWRDYLDWQEIHFTRGGLA